MAAARPVNAQFVVSGDVSISPSQPGLEVDDGIAEAVENAAYGGNIAEASRLEQTRADLTTAEAGKLGIREQISSFTTEMGTSSSNRIHNVHLMADYVDGTVIKPGESSRSTTRSGRARSSAASARAR